MTEKGMDTFALGTSFLGQSGLPEDVQAMIPDSTGMGEPAVEDLPESPVGGGLNELDGLGMAVDGNELSNFDN